MRRTSGLAVLVLASVTVLAGCSSSGDGGSSPNTVPDTAGTSAGGALSSTAASLAGKKACMDKYVTAPPVDDAVNGVKDALAGSGVELVVQSSETDAGTMQTILSQFINDDCDIFVPVATPTAQATAKAVKDKPVVFVGSSTPVDAGLVQSLEAPGGNVTGVSDPYPVVAEIDAMLKIKPGIKSVGLIWKNGDPAGDVLARQATEHLESLGLEVVNATISNASEVSQAAQSLVGKVDAIELPGDATTISAVPAVLKVANSNDLPVFGSTSDTVKQGGIVAGTYNYTDVGHAAGELVLDILRGADPATTPVVVPESIELTVNPKAAQTLGLSIPADLHATKIG